MTELTTMPTSVTDLRKLTDLDKLAEILEGTLSSNWSYVRSCVLAQFDDPADGEKLFEAASELAMHNANCATGRSALRESLRQLGLHAADAQRQLAELGGPLFDVEYAEGTGGRVLADTLDTIARHIFASQAVNEQIMRSYEPTTGGAR